MDSSHQSISMMIAVGSPEPTQESALGLSLMSAEDAWLLQLSEVELTKASDGWGGAGWVGWEASFPVALLLVTYEQAHG